jgi:hypothetical protein
MNYGELRTIIASRLDRPDQGTAIIDAVAAATARLTRVLRVYDQEVISDATLVSEYTELPLDFNGMRSLSTSDGKRLDYCAPEFFQDVVQAGSTRARPAFTIVDLSIRVYPAPSVAAPLTVAMLYNLKLVPPLADGDTNPVMEDHPDLYIAATMAELMLHMKNYDTHAVWESRTKELAMETIIASRRKRFTGGALAIKLGA